MFLRKKHGEEIILTLITINSQPSRKTDRQDCLIDKQINKHTCTHYYTEARQLIGQTATKSQSYLHVAEMINRNRENNINNNQYSIITGTQRGRVGIRR